MNELVAAWEWNLQADRDNIYIAKTSHMYVSLMRTQIVFFVKQRLADVSQAVSNCRVVEKINAILPRGKGYEVVCPPVEDRMRGVCLKIRIPYGDWSDHRDEVLGVAKKLVGILRENDVWKENAGELDVREDSTAMNETTNPKSANSTPQKSHKGQLDWSDITFCNSGIVDPKKIVDALVGKDKVFPESLKTIFRQRYEKMQQNFMAPLESKIWAQGGTSDGVWGRGLSMPCDQRGKICKDAFLRIDRECFDKKDNFWVGEDGLLNYPCVGHDLPIWLSPEKREVRKRIMMISQDPLRGRLYTGALYLSTPWALHSKAYRSEKVLYKLLNRLVRSGCGIYLTDINKVYNKEGGKSCSGNAGERSVCRYSKSCCTKLKEMQLKKTRVQHSLIIANKTAIRSEIEQFRPDYIVALGDFSTCAPGLWPLQFEPCNLEPRDIDVRFGDGGGEMKKALTLYHPSAHMNRAMHERLRKLKCGDLSEYYDKAFDKIMSVERKRQG